MAGKVKQTGKRMSGSKSLGKRKSRENVSAPALPTATVEGKIGGDDDDFEYMLNEMPEAPQSDSASEAVGAAEEHVVDAEHENGDEQQLPTEPAASEPSKKKKKQKHKKKGPQPSAVEFEASREMAAEIAESGAADQADWLWHSFQQSTGASSLEREGLTATCFVELPKEGSLEERLKSLDPRWRSKFCNKSGSKGEGSRANGAPALLMVSPAAMGAIKLIKHCPTLHQACRIVKLFAKHIKVPEQQELLAKNVVCVGAGTPNRITKLVDLEALKLDNLNYVVVDTSLDAKKRTILDIPETRDDWWELFSKHLRPRLAAGSTKLVLVNSDRLA